MRHQLAVNMRTLACRHTCAFSRLVSPELCCSFTPMKDQRAQGRPGAGGTRNPYAQKCTRSGSQASRSPGLPCADGFNVSFVILCPQNLPECANGRFSPTARR
nr:hypothetical protein BDOA9_0132290 [Bradyrhizobium sp. DOA9]